MERDSFESKLQQIVLAKEQQSFTKDKAAGDRAWAKVIFRKRISSWWLSAAAMLLVAFGLCVLIPSPQQNQPQVKAEELVKNTGSPIKKNTVEIAVAHRVPNQMIADRPIPPVKQQQNPGDTLIRPSIEPLAITTATTTAVGPVLDKVVAKKDVEEQGVTIQFKRGKTMAQEEEPTIKIAIRKFRLKAESSYYAAGEEEKKSPLKIKF